MKDLINNSKFLVAFVAGAATLLLTQVIVNGIMHKQNCRITFKIGIENSAAPVELLQMPNSLAAQY